LTVRCQRRASVLVLNDKRRKPQCQKIVRRTDLIDPIPGAAPHNAVILRACGVSSTPRLLGSITHISGILDRPLEPVIGRHDAPTRWRTMTAEEFVCGHSFATPRRDAPESCMNLSPLEGVGNAGCPLHPQPRVHFVVVESTRATTSTPERPAFPHAMVLTAYVVLSPVTGLVCHRRQRIEVLSKPGWADATPRT